MRKLAIITLLAIVLIACAPVMPAQNQTQQQPQEQPPAENQSQEQPAAENQTQEQPAETNETMEEPAVPVDTRDLPVKELTEGELVSFPGLKAVDPDGDPIAYTFTEPLNDKGMWQTKEGDAGEHIITITASDGTNTVSQQVLLRVNAKNKAPIIELEGPVEGVEGGTLILIPDITDPDGDEVTITYSGWMTNDTREVEFGDAGTHKVIITASDGKSTTTKEVVILIANENREPAVVALDPINVKEGEKVIVRPKATDPDGTNLTFSYSEPLDAKGTWQTKIGDAGEYESIVTASDGELTTEATVLIIVEAVNRAPIIEIESPVVLKEGMTVVLEPIVTDPEGQEVKLTYSGWMNSNTRITNYEDAGNHRVTIRARDAAGAESSLDVIVSVEDTNRPPIFGAGSFN